MSKANEQSPRSARAGMWVEISRTVLEPGARAPQVPQDTQRVPLQMRVKGFAVHDGEVGQTMTVRTPTGRSLSGALEEVEPAYTHGFGAPVPELLGIGRELRALLTASGPADE